MPFLEPTMTSSSGSDFNEHRWVIQMRRTLEEELEEETDIPVSIFNVPKNLLASQQSQFLH